MPIGRYRILLLAAILLAVLSLSASAAIEVLDSFYRPDRMLGQFFYLWNINYAWGDDPPVYTASGQLCVYLRNTGTSSVTISDLTLQGVSLTRAIGCETKTKYQNQLCYACSLHYPSSNPISSAERQTLIDAGEPVWWRVLPSTIPAGGTAEVYVRMRTRVLADLSLTIVPSTGSSIPVSISVTDADIPRIAGYALSSDMSKLYLYLRHMQAGKAPNRIIIDGADVTARCTIAADPDVDIVPVVCNLAAPFVRGSFHHFAATYDDGTKASAGLRVFSDEFKHCLWGGPYSTTNAEAAAHIRSMGDHSITTQVLGAGFGNVDDYMATAEGKALMDEFGITRLPNDPAKATGRLWGLFLCDEPDCAEKSVPTTVCPTYAQPGVMTQSLWYRANGFRTTYPTVPTVLNVDGDNRPYNWYHYGQIADIFSTDPYITHRLRDSYWNRPQQQPVHVKSAYTYGWACTSKAACEPRPYHCIINCSRLQIDGKIWRYSTPSEHRIQAYYVIAGGATQLAHWWFTPKAATDIGSAGCGTDEPAAAAIWREIGLIGAELGTAGPVIVRSIPVQMPVTASPRLWVRPLIAGHDTLVLVCVNDDYSSIDTGTMVRPIDHAEVGLDLPGWLTAASVFEVDHTGVRDVPFDAAGPRINIHLGPVGVTRLVLITSDTALKAALQERYNTRFGPNVSHIIGSQ